MQKFRKVAGNIRNEVQFCKFVAYQRMTLKKFHSASDYLQENYEEFLFVAET